MKLALIRRQFTATGGAELYLQRLLAALTARGHELHLFSEAWNDAPANVVLHRVENSANRTTRNLFFANAVKEKISREKFDCVFSLERTLQQDVYRAGDGVHRVWLQKRKQFSPWWKNIFPAGAFHKNLLALEAQTFDPKNTKRVIVNSEMVRNEILENFSFPAERIHLVRNGVDVARFQNGDRAATRKKLGVAENEFLFLFVGSGWERKGLRFALAAFELLKRKFSNLKFAVIGKDRELAFAQNGVFFPPATSNLENYYAAADLFLFPPIYEPSANVVVEALAAGLPVITSANNGAGEIISENITGNVVQEFWNPKNLAASAEKWIAQPLRVKVDLPSLSLERNVFETLAVLELAAQEKAR
jgi:UDP-glucose:(heptosyl)LPS alpha-1,3-glucosyltransferase